MRDPKGRRVLMTSGVFFADAEGRKKARFTKLDEEAKFED
jgi:hypothetical protein